MEISEVPEAFQRSLAVFESLKQDTVEYYTLSEIVQWVVDAASVHIS